MSEVVFPYGIYSEEIVPKTRKLKATWTYEAQQDLQAFHNLDAENELSKILAEEITKEIDEEILADLRANAETAKQEEFLWKNRKKKIIPRPIDSDWEVSRFD